MPLHDEPNQTSANVRLEPIREPEYGAWLAQSMAEYAEEKVQAGNYHLDEALHVPNSESCAVAAGAGHPGQHLFSIVDATTGDRVGVTWFTKKQRGPRLEAFIYDLVVLEPFRRRSYARGHDRDRGRSTPTRHRSDRLHVFSHKRGAWALYNQLGYEVTNVQMAKTITHPQP